MSVVGLRVDICSADSSVEEISKCLRHKKQFITLMLCLRVLGFMPPRDIRRLIALYCTIPAPSMLPSETYFSDVVTYHQFYMSHLPTQKYNPYIYSTGCPGALVAAVVQPTVDYSFHHPFPQYLPGPSLANGPGVLAMVLGSTCHVPICTVDNGRYLYRLRAIGEDCWWIGIEATPEIISARIYYKCGDSYALCKLGQPILVQAFGNIDGVGVVTSEMLEKLYRGPVDILPLKTIIHQDKFPEIDIYITASAPIRLIKVVYGVTNVGSARTH